MNLEFGSSLATLQFMSPRQPEHLAGSGAGLMYNFAVDDVDEEYRRLTAEGLPVVVPIEDHPWGDRGFAVQDPNAITLYIFSERVPDDEFRQYYH